MRICNVTVKVIGGRGFEATEEANMRRLFLVMRTPKVLHQMRLLPESVQAKDAFVGSDTGMRTQMHIDVCLGAQNDSADGTLGFFPRLVHQV